MHYRAKRLTFRLIKSDKNYRTYNLYSITIVLYFLYMSANQMNFQFKNAQKFLMDLDWCRLVFVFFQILLFLFEQELDNFWWSIKSEIDTFSDKQSRSIKNSGIVWAKSSFEKNIYGNDITRLLDSFNNNCDNFCPIWSK